MHVATSDAFPAECLSHPLKNQKMSLMVTQQQQTKFGGTIRNIASHFAAHKKRMAA